jgi:RHS repeat-associated protein
MLTDSNGNQITVSGGQIFDTLSSTVPVLTVLGTPSAPPVKYQFTNPQGTNSFVTVNYKPYTVQTDFACGIAEYNQPNIPLVDTIVMPDNGKYTFTYETTPNNSSAVTGRLASITLPTGGSISYTYTGSNNGIICADGSTAGLQRQVSPGGTWTYARSGSGNTWTTTGTSPSTSSGYDTATISFEKDSATFSYPTYNFFETQRIVKHVYQGTSTVLATTIKCYNALGNAAPATCYNQAVRSPISEVADFRYLPNSSGSQAETDTFYDMYGLVTNVAEYDFGSGKVGPLLRATAIAYNRTLTNNIVDRPSSMQVSDSSGHLQVKTTYTYDEAAPTASGATQLKAVVGSRGNVTTIATQANSTTTLYRKFTYYDTGMLNTSTDVSTSSTSTCTINPATCTTYNYSSSTNSCNFAFPTSLSEPLSLSRSMTWACTGGVVTQVKDENSNPTNYTYGDANYWRLTQSSFPDGGSRSATYNFGTNSPWNIQTSAAKDTSTNVTGKTVLDGLGRVVQTQSTSDPSGNTDYVDTVYDSMGRVASVSNPYQTTTDATYGITQYGYDSLGRITALIHPDNTQATFNYSGAAGQAIDEGNNSGGSTQVQKVYQTDGLGRVVSVCKVSSKSQLGSSGTPSACGQGIAATGFLTSYGYDPLSNILSVTQGSLTRSYYYDNLSRLTQEINPESGTTSYTYDTFSAGDLYQRTRPKQNQTGSATVVTTHSFDALHRLTGKSYNDSLTSSVALSYDQTSHGGINLANPKGRLTYAAAGGTASTIFSYDTMGRIAGDWQCTPLNCGTGSFSLQYQYDYLGDVTQFANAREGATYTYSYDTLARLTKLQSSVSDSNHPGTLLTVNTYNPLGEATKATLGNGIVRNVGYDNRGRLTSLTDGSIYSFALGFAPDNDIVTGNDFINGNWNYGYDDFNRISASNKNSGQQTFSYVYDRYSNRWQQNAPQGGPAPQYSFNGNNQITGSGVLYDAAGNVTNDGLGNTYTYDAENRLISMSGTNSASYVYDALGQRVRSTINSTPYDFIYNGGRAIDEVNASNWVWGDAGALQAAVYANATTYFSHSDWLGTVRAWSNVSGGSIGTCTSLPFGDAQTCAGLSPNPWHYTGQPLDSENSLQHFLFRQESAIQGRWMSPDPAGLGAVDHSNPQTWNRYAYVMNNPLSFTGSLGLNVDASGCHEDAYTTCVTDGGGGGWSTCYAFCGGGGGGGTSVSPANNGFTLGIRAPGQTYSQCLAANSGNYSVYNWLPSSAQNGGTKFALGNDVSNALFGDANEGTAGLVVGAGVAAAPLGTGTAGTFGRRTASIFDLNLSGTTGPAPTILGKTGAAEVIGWVSGAFELKLAADIGATAAEALNCIGHR